MSILISGCGAGGSGNDQKESSGASTFHSAKIINGSPLNDNQATFMKRLFIADEAGNIGLCSGTFINAYTYLTAAHCLHGSQGQVLPPENFALQALPGAFFQPVAVVPHPHYQHGAAYESIFVPGTIYFPFDIGLLVFDRQIVDRVLPLSSHVPSEGQEILLLGYGQSVAGQPSDGVLRGATTHVDAVDYPEGVFFWAFDEATEGTTCHGDSGGPAIAQFGDDYLLVGVTSGGVPGDCRLGSYAFDTSVANYLDFIDQVTGGDYYLD